MLISSQKSVISEQNRHPSLKKNQNKTLKLTISLCWYTHFRSVNDHSTQLFTLSINKMDKTIRTNLRVRLRCARWWSRISKRIFSHLGLKIFPSVFAERPPISVSQNVAAVQIQGKGGERLTNQKRGHGPESQSKWSVHVISAWVQRPCARGVWMVLLCRVLWELSMFTSCRRPHRYAAHAFSWGWIIMTISYYFGVHALRKREEECGSSPTVNAI